MSSIHDGVRPDPNEGRIRIERSARPDTPPDDAERAVGDGSAGGGRLFPKPGGPPKLKIGMQGPDVAAVQRLLTALGYRIGNEEIAARLFGQSTRNAVSLLQRKAGLAATGAVDGPTRRAIREALRKERRGEPEPPPTGRPMIPGP